MLGREDYMITVFFLVIKKACKIFEFNHSLLCRVGIWCGYYATYVLALFVLFRDMFLSSFLFLQM